MTERSVQQESGDHTRCTICMHMVGMQADSKKARAAAHTPVKAGMKRKSSELCDEAVAAAVPDQDLGPRPNPMPVGATSHCCCCCYGLRRVISHVLQFMEQQDRYTTL